MYTNVHLLLYVICQDHYLYSIPIIFSILRFWNTVHDLSTCPQSMAIMDPSFNITNQSHRANGPWALFQDHQGKRMVHVLVVRNADHSGVLDGRVGHEHVLYEVRRDQPLLELDQVAHYSPKVVEAVDFVVVDHVPGLEPAAVVNDVGGVGLEEAVHAGAGFYQEFAFFVGAEVFTRFWIYNLENKSSRVV